MRAGLWLAGALLIAACGGTGAAATDATDVIAREVFVQTFVQLRMAALDNRPDIITQAEKDSILAEHEVSEEELELFLTVHGPDLSFMRDLWADIEGEILSLLSPEDDSEPTMESGN